ncbi:zinc finger protein Rlf [Thalassophryne amazonica]|uniref:zinc finger protein Rlf n=1 Tax=Thalassophryne amazonica TaxID=390379 RepID=UPI001471CE7E|nr:zinc finger protein Rlf [Thalassophryne amazonica]
MAESNVETEHEWSDRALDSAEDTLVAMETLLATLRAFEDVLSQQDISVASSNEYCDNFCQALMHYAGSRNSVEHGLPLLEVYCLSINCFAAARCHLTADSDSVTLVLKRLALSCFELLLSVPENEIPYEAWVQFHHFVQSAHDTLLQYGSTDLQALLQITGEGGAWNNPVLTALLTGQPTSREEVDGYITLEGEGFMEMRVKHLEKIGEVAKAVVLAKACTECSLVTNQATFRQTYVSLLCQLLPNEEAIREISRLDCKDVLEITCNLETEGEENTAFILCTTFLTQQLQQQSLYCSWELTLLWSKLQRRIDPSLESLLERCLQLGAIAKIVDHLLFLVRIIQAEARELGLASSVELCVKALQLPKKDDNETRISVCKTVSILLPGDLEVLRACLLTEFLLGPRQEVFGHLEELYLRPDQKYDQENGVIPNSLRCELLLALKAHWPFDPEFWDWKTLKYQCTSLLGLKVESEGEEEEPADREESSRPHEPHEIAVKCVESEQQNRLNGSIGGHEQKDDKHAEIEDVSRIKKHKLCCQICSRSFTDTQILPHSRRHGLENIHPCPVCLKKFQSRKELVPHMKQHVHSEASFYKKEKQIDSVQIKIDENDELEPGEITIDPSLMLYYKSTHDQDVLNHIVQQAKSVQAKRMDDDVYITFDHIERHYELQNRDEYPCPGTGCPRVFKHSKYLYVHLKSEHKDDENVKHFHLMRDKREKCGFCRRHFVSDYHHRKHRQVHHGEQPFTCVVIGCGARFRSSYDLITHKQTHGYQLNYQCELKGCYVSFSDLGQLYHHEAQHFRDAGFTCCSPECSKYYFSKREFIDHLSTHNITFSENDFEAQMKAKQKLFKTLVDKTVHVTRSSGSEKTVNLEYVSPPSLSCISPLQPTEFKEPKAVTTLVAVCFDGSKFTCGFERCGMTFTRARDVQRHLKCAHPEHLKLEPKEHKHDSEWDSTSKELKAEIESHGEEKESDELPNPFHSLDTGRERLSSHQPRYIGTYSSSSIKNDSLKEILIGLSKLSLNGSNSAPSEPLMSNTPSCPSQTSLHQAIMAKPPVVLLQKRHPYQSKKKVRAASNKSSTAEKICAELLAIAKPYVCEVKSCGFRTAQSYSLLRHYNNLHGRSISQAKRLTSLKSTFKPYVCQLCSKRHREKRVLRAHYIQAHHFTDAMVNKINCNAVPADEKKTTVTAVHTSKSLNCSLEGKEIPALHHQNQSEKSNRVSENGQNMGNHSSEEEGDDEADSREEEREQKEQGQDVMPQQARPTRRLVAKSKLCYILDKYSKPFHCVAKHCDAAFSTQAGLVRHLQLVHHYNRSQLLLEKDFDVHRSSDIKKEPARKRPVTNSDEPQPQFKCHFANCNASYHLKSSLVRHIRLYHSQAPGLVRCKQEGCTKVFTHDNALKKHILYSHCEYYDSLVVRLQSTHKKSITGCQKKLIVTSQSSVKEPSSPAAQPEKSDPKSEATSQSEKMDESHHNRSKVSEKRNTFDSYVYRSHEEALQMCQDRCLRVAHPCMVQHCDSVVSYMHSLHRHYMKVHRMPREVLMDNEDKLAFNAEQLEELIQRKSARPTSAGASTPNGVRKMEYQAETDKLGGQSAPMGLLSIKNESQEEENHDLLGLPEEKVEEPSPVERNDDDHDHGERSTSEHTEESVAGMENGQQEKQVNLQNFKTLLRPVTVDLSPPCSLRFTNEGFQDSSSTNDGSKMLNGSAELSSSPVRQPLKRKNELSEQPPNLKEPERLSPAPRPFDIATYKPMGFESSFLKFIQENTPQDNSDVSLLKHGDVVLLKGRDSFRRSCSIKENTQLGISLTCSRRTQSPLLRPRAMTGHFTSVQNLKSVLDKALAGCGDLAIKQLQYLRPVLFRSVLQCAVFLVGTTNMARFLRPAVRGFITAQLRMSSDQLGELGKGAGKGGGGGGSIREAGGAMGKRQAAEEELYFRRKEQELFAALKEHHHDEIEHHKMEIERLQREIDRHKGKIRKLKHDD